MDLVELAADYNGDIAKSRTKKIIERLDRPFYRRRMARSNERMARRDPLRPDNGYRNSGPQEWQPGIASNRTGWTPGGPKKIY